jgi:phosphate acyltransferase
LRRLPRASIRVATDMAARDRHSAVVSAGNTGATVMAAHAAFGMLPGVDRPALATVIPTRRRPAVLLDAGATVECRPQHLLQFAVMGAVHARLTLGTESPRVGLLSIGEEETKGNELTREAHRLLKSAPLNFIGNIEGREIYSGEADVVVCDGFTGNIVLKTSEGLVEAIDDVLDAALRDVPAGREAFERFRRRMDYSEYGGAPLLGVAGLTIVAHGRSSPRAMRNAIAMAARYAGGDFVSRVERDIAAATVS